MPTINPRVNVTLSPSMDALVTRLAKLERVSKANVLRELLASAEPALVHAIALMEAAEGAGAKAREMVGQDMKAVVRAVEGTAALAVAGLARGARDLVDDAQSVRARRPGRGKRPAAAPGRAPKAPRPPSSNRGVKS